MCAKRSFIKKGDLVLYALIVALGVLIFLCFSNKNGTIVTVAQHGKTLYSFDLADAALEGKEFVIDGEYQNTLSIRNGKLYVTKATCPDRLCEQSLPLTSGGGVICCVPNGVIITAQTEKTQWDVVVK